MTTRSNAQVATTAAATDATWMPSRAPIGGRQHAVAEREVAAVPAAVPEHQAVGPELHDPVELGGLVDSAPAQQADGGRQDQGQRAPEPGAGPVPATRCGPIRGSVGVGR